MWNFRRTFKPTEEERIEDLEMVLKSHNNHIGDCSTCANHISLPYPGFVTAYGECKKNMELFPEKVCGILKIEEKEEPPAWLYHTTWEKCGEVDFDAIEKALGFRLFGWQKAYILDGYSYASRRTGKTTAMILQQLLAVNEEPIDFSKPAPLHRIAAIRYDYHQIWKKLYDAGIKMRPVFWNAMDKKKYEVESKDVSARSKERTMVKMDPYRYAREAFAEYEAEHYTCLDCSSCRYDDINEVYYCRRSYSIIDKPDEMSECDDFDKGELNE